MSSSLPGLGKERPCLSLATPSPHSVDSLVSGLPLHHSVPKGSGEPPNLRAPGVCEQRVRVVTPRSQRSKPEDGRDHSDVPPRSIRPLSMEMTKGLRNDKGEEGASPAC